MALKTDYKDDVFEGNRKYLISKDADENYEIVDVTSYSQEGDLISAEVLNAIGAVINQMEAELGNKSSGADHSIKTYTTLEQINIDESNMSATDFQSNIIAINEAVPTGSAFLLHYAVNGTNSNLVQSIVAKINTDLGLSLSASGVIGNVMIRRGTDIRSNVYIDFALESLTVLNTVYSATYNLDSTATHRLSAFTASKSTNGFSEKDHNHAAGDISSGTLGVARGGTGVGTMTSGAALIGNGTGTPTFRAITNLTAKGAASASTNLATANTVVYHAQNRLNRTGAVNEADTGYATYMARGIALVAAVPSSLVNGACAFVYS